MTEARMNRGFRVGKEITLETTLTLQNVTAKLNTPYEIPKGLGRRFPTTVFHPSTFGVGQRLTQNIGACHFQSGRSSAMSACCLQNHTSGSDSLRGLPPSMRQRSRVDPPRVDAPLRP